MTAPAEHQEAIRPGFAPPPLLRRVGGYVLNAYAAFVLFYLFLPVAVIVAEATASCWDSRRVRRNHELRALRALMALLSGLGTRLFTYLRS